MVEHKMPSGASSDNPTDHHTSTLSGIMRPVDVDALALEVGKATTIIDMASERMNSLCQGLGEADSVWLYVEEAMRQHLAEIGRLIGRGDDDADDDPEEAAAHVMALCERSAAEDDAGTDAPTTIEEMDHALDALGRTPITSVQGVRDAAAALSRFIEERGVEPHEDAIKAILGQIAGFEDRRPLVVYALPRGLEEVVHDVERAVGMMAGAAFADSDEPAIDQGRVHYLSDRLVEHVAELTALVYGRPIKGAQS